MNDRIKSIFTCFILVVALCVSRPSAAQMYYPEVTFKDSLIQMLFQYGREVYYRGLDPQEASYVFQRILILDCNHDGAQEFLSKIQNKYPNVSIKIRGCSETEQFSDSTEFNVRAKDFLKTPSDDKFSFPDRTRDLSDYTKEIKETLAETRSDETKETKETKVNVSARGTPVAGYSKPTVEETSVKDSTRSLPDLSKPSSILDAQTHSDTLTDPSRGYVPGLSEDCAQLKISYKKLQSQVMALEEQVKTKDEIILTYTQQLADYQQMNSSSYAAIAHNQRDLIRIQQGNIDYLQQELNEAKEQLAANQFEGNPEYDRMHNEIANSQLLAQEIEMNFEAKNREAQQLQKQLGELQEQLQLIKKILIEKNDIIKALEEELETLKLQSNNKTF